MGGVCSSRRELLKVLHPDRRENFLIGAIAFTVMAIVDAAVERRLLPPISMAHGVG